MTSWSTSTRLRPPTSNLLSVAAGYNPTTHVVSSFLQRVSIAVVYNSALVGGPANSCDTLFSSERGGLENVDQAMWVYDGDFVNRELAKPTSIFRLKLRVVIGIYSGAFVVLLLFVISLFVIRLVRMKVGGGRARSAWVGEDEWWMIHGMVCRKLEIFLER